MDSLIHTLDPDRALASLGGSRQGLASAEAGRRLAQFGRNAIEEVRGEPLLLRVLESFTHFFAIILWLAAALAFFAEWNQPGEGMAVLGAAIIGVILVNGVFAVWQEYRAERTLEALARLLPHLVKAVRDGGVVETPAAELVPGDVIDLGEGDSVPADCRVIEAFGLRVETAALTGESVPHSRDARATEADDPLIARNILLSGCSVVSGEGQAVVFATGRRTEFGRIAHLTQRVRPGRSPILREIAFVSRLVAALATGLGVVFFAIGLELGIPFWSAFLFAIGIIVANVPEGLLPTVTLALAMGARRMAARRALIRNLPAVETLGSATVICTDKTGTLTENRMTVRALHLAGATYPVEAVNSGTAAPPALLEPFLDIARHCHTLKRTANADKRWLGDPVEIALATMAEAARPGAPERPRLGEIPFDSERKRLSVVTPSPAGATLHVKGALDTVLPLCRRAAAGDGEVELTAASRAEIRGAEARMAEKGLRVLALAWRALEPGWKESDDWERDLVFAGLAGFEDPPRAGVREAIAKAKAAGIRVIMTTGDHPSTAKAVARQIGLDGGKPATVVSGPELKALSNGALARVLEAPALIFARINPEQKLRVVRALQEKGEIVAVTGDGVNDAPALKEAEIGIAMGKTGSDVAREAADMVLLDDNFASIVDAVEEGRAVFDNIRKFMTYILTSNVPEIVPYLAFVLFGIPLPLTIIQILAVDLGTDMLPALALGAEPPHPGAMSRPPRGRGQRLLDTPLLLRAYLFLGPLEAVAAMAAYFFVLDRGGWSWGEPLAARDPLYLQATTACLTAIVVAQVANVFLCRSDRASVFALKFFENRLIFWGILFEVALILLIVYTDVGNLLFGTAPIGWQVWAFALPFAVLMVAAEEARKLAVRRRASPR